MRRYRIGEKVQNRSGGKGQTKRYWTCEEVQDRRRGTGHMIRYRICEEEQPGKEVQDSWRGTGQVTMRNTDKEINKWWIGTAHWCGTEHVKHLTGTGSLLSWRPDWTMMKYTPPPGRVDLQRHTREQSSLRAYVCGRQCSLTQCSLIIYLSAHLLASAGIYLLYLYNRKVIHLL